MATREVARFHWADYLVFGISLLVTIGIGIYHGCRGRKGNTEDYLMGSRDMSVIPVSLSLIVSFLSAISVLGIPSEVYNYGIQAWWTVSGYAIALIIASFFYLPVYHKLKVTSAFEYFELRFNKVVRTTASIISSIQMILYSAVALYAPAIALSQVTGFDYMLCIWVSAAVCTIYTTLGGLRAVLWTDSVQCLIMLIGLLATIIKGTMVTGGLGKVWNISDHGGRLNLWNPDPNPFIRQSFWGFLIGDTFTILSLYAASQSQIQRFCSIKKISHAQGAVLGCMFSNIVFISLLVLAGLVAYSVYYTCDPKEDGLITRSDQILPLLVMDLLGPQRGLPGLFLASTISAALSTLSSSQNALAAVWLEDIIKPLHKKTTGHVLGETKGTIVSKLLVFIFGIFIAGLAALCGQLGRLLYQISHSTLSLIGGPLLGAFTLGLFVPFANAWGLLTGLLAGLLAVGWVVVGAFMMPSPAIPLPVSTTGCQMSPNTSYTLNYTNSFSTSPDTLTNTFSTYSTPGSPVSEPLLFYKLSYRYYALFGTIVTLIIGIIVSLIASICVGKKEVKQTTLFKCSHLSKCCSRKAEKYNTNGIQKPEKYISVSSM